MYQILCYHQYIKKEMTIDISLMNSACEITMEEFLKYDCRIKKKYLNQHGLTVNNLI